MPKLMNSTMEMLTIKNVKKNNVDTNDAFVNSTDDKLRSTENVTDPTSHTSQAPRMRFIEIMEKYHNGTEEERQEAMCKAINELHGLIFAIIKRSYPTYMSEYYDDMEQEGKIGIIRGLKKYDPQISMPSTWFYPYIKHEIQGFIDENVIRTTAHYSANLRKIDKAIQRLEDLGVEYTNVELSIQTGLTLETVNQAMAIRNCRNEVYYDACPDAVLNDVAVSAENTSPEDILVAKETESMLFDALNNSLSPDERAVIVLSFGLGESNKPMSNKNIANTLHMPIDKVKKLHMTAMRKLRNSPLKHAFKDYLSADDTVISASEIPLMSTSVADKDIVWLEMVDIDF